MLYFVAWLTDFAALLFVFTGTRFLAEQGASAVTLGSVGGAFFLASAVSNALSGRMADVTGRGRVASCGALLFVASLGIVAIIAPNGWLFYTAYTGAGISLGMIYPAVMAWVGQGKGAHATSRTYLIFCLAFNLGILSAQLSGGWLFEEIGSHAPLWVAIGLAGLSYLCLCRYQAEDHDIEDSEIGLLGQRDTRIARAFARLTWMANFGGMFSMSLVWFLFPKLVVGLNVGASVHGALLAGGRVVVMSTYCLMHCFPFWRYGFRFAAIAQLLGIVGLTLLGIATTPIALALGIGALSVLMGYNYFASLYYNAMGHTASRQGSAFGMNEAFLGFGAAGGSLIGGLIGTESGIRAPFQLAALLLATLLLAQGIVWLKLVRPLQTVPRV